MKISGIYQIQSKIKSERIYIGSAIDIMQRWNVHLCDLKHNRHNPKLQRHFNKYGESDLVFSILLGCAKEYLIANEQFFIDSYKPYFNICPIAGSSLGIKFSDESKVKMSKCKIGNKYGLGKNKGNKNALGHKHTQEWKEMFSDFMKGRKNRLGQHCSLEHKMNISKAKKGISNYKLKGKPWNEKRRKAQELKKIA
jgi:group I intron endonuclease